MKLSAQSFPSTTLHASWKLGVLIPRSLRKSWCNSADRENRDRRFHFRGAFGAVTGEDGRWQSINSKALQKKRHRPHAILCFPRAKSFPSFSSPYFFSSGAFPIT